MKIRDHPTFEKKRSKTTGTALTVFILGFGILFFLPDRVWGIYFFSLCGLFLYSWYYLSYLMPSKVECPDCGADTKTKTQKPEGYMVAVCTKCLVKWNLGDRFVD